jgi:hypothetical protein
LLLAEIGEEGQDALCESSLAGLRGDARATEVAQLYLERAGVRFIEASRGEEARAADADAVTALAGRPELREAAAFLAGALAALEQIKAVVRAGVASPAELEVSLTGPEG